MIDHGEKRLLDIVFEGLQDIRKRSITAKRGYGINLCFEYRFYPSFDIRVLAFGIFPPSGKDAPLVDRHVYHHHAIALASPLDLSSITG